VSPRLQADVQELKIVADQFSAKYGKPYAQACKENAVGTVSVKLMHKLSVQAPPKITVEKYLIEIARYYNVDYEPDPLVMCQDEVYSADNLIELAPTVPGKNDLDDDNRGPGGGSGGGGFAAPPGLPGYDPAPAPFQYPNIAGAAAFPPPPSHEAPYPPAFQYNIPNRPDSPNSNVETKSNLNMLDDDEDGGAPPPYFPPDQTKEELSQQEPTAPATSYTLDLPDLPAVPSDTPLGSKIGTPHAGPEEDIDFDDLTKRFEALKKKK